MSMILNFVLNGAQQTVLIQENSTLLDVVRNQLGLTGTKEACAHGDCGACTVLLDGDPVNSCIMLAAEVEGREVETVEGLAKTGELSPLQEAFLEEGAVQCGFCTPGMLMTATALLRENPHPDREAIKEGMSGVICRCTGYTKIVGAVERCAKKKE